MRRNVLAARAHKQVFFSVRDDEKAFFVKVADVARPEPSILSDGCPCGVFHVPVSLEDLGPSHQDLAVFVDLLFCPGHGSAHSAGLHPELIEYGGVAESELGGRDGVCIGGDPLSLFDHHEIQNRIHDLVEKPLIEFPMFPGINDLRFIEIDHRAGLCKSVSFVQLDIQRPEEYTHLF